MKALELKNVYKSYGGKNVIDNLSFSIEENSVFGFLGNNGAGKTTTMKLILGFLKVNNGEIKVFGKNVKYGETKTNRMIGYLPDVPKFYEYMTALEYLILCVNIVGIKGKEARYKSLELLELVGLKDENKKIKGFSRGMKQRLGFAQALVNNPKLLICDEPTSALDPLGRKEILELISKVKEYTTVLFSTHILSDVESVCSDVLILNDGKNIMTGSISDLKKLKKTSQIEIIFETSAELKICKASISNLGIKNTIFENKMILFSENIAQQREYILKILCDNNLFPLELRIKKPTLEDIFMEAVKK